MVQKVQPLVVCALKEEFESDKYPVLYTGMGKLNSVLSLNRTICRDPARYNLIVNFGSCGSHNTRPGTLTRVTITSQWDLNLPAGFPDQDRVLIEPDELGERYRTKNKLINAYCATGDSFASNEKMQELTRTRHPMVFDMEAAALALYCLSISKPFLCFKWVSDSGDESEWRDFLTKRCDQFHEVLDGLL